jgi:hypothetical protein
MKRHIKKKLLIISIIHIVSISLFPSNLSFAQSISNGLNVIAKAEDVISIPGNQLPIYIIVSVIDQSGQPLTNLKLLNFELNTIITPPGGSLLIKTIRLIETNIEGIYLLYIIPHEQKTWKNGVYIFAISVTKDKFRGQTLVNVLVD